MNKTRLWFFICLPILTWLLIWSYQQLQRYLLLKRQHQEFVLAKRRLEELGRNLRGIKVNALFPISLPFRHTYLGRAPSIGRGQPVILWVTYQTGYSFRQEVVKRYMRLLDECPSLVLIVAICFFGDFEPDISLQEIMQRMRHPRITFLYSSDEALYNSLGAPGTVTFIDGKGLVRYVGKLRAPILSEEEIEDLIRLVKASGGGGR